MTHKSASHLQDAFKSKMKHVNRESTRCPHANVVDSLQLIHCDEVDQRNCMAEFQETVAPSHPIPPPPATDLETRPITREAVSQTEEEDCSEFHNCLEMQPPSNKRMRGKNDAKCATKNGPHHNGCQCICQSVKAQIMGTKMDSCLTFIATFQHTRESGLSST